MYRKNLTVAAVFAAIVLGLGIPIYRQVTLANLNASLATKIEQGDFQSAISLLREGADPNTCIYIEKPVSIWDRLLDVAKWRSRNNVGRRRQEPVLIAVTHMTEADSGILQALLYAGARINIEGEEGETALSVAAEEGKTDLVELLLNHQANVNIPDNHGWTALMHACISAPYRGQPVIVQDLLNNGAAINARNDRQETALMLAAERKPDTVKVLIEHRADMNAEDCNGHNAIAIAEWANSSESIALLKSARAKR